MLLWGGAWKLNTAPSGAAPATPTVAAAGFAVSQARRQSSHVSASHRLVSRSRRAGGTASNDPGAASGRSRTDAAPESSRESKLPPTAFMCSRSAASPESTVSAF
jgi:hypothetical protein